MEKFELLYKKYFTTSISNSRYIFVPHASINYSGFCAYVALRSINWSNVDTIILLSTNHFLNNNVTIDQEHRISYNIKLEPFEFLETMSFDIINKEHSWSFLMPLFEHLSKNITIKLILARSFDSNLSINIQKCMRENDKCILIANSDLSHSNGHFQNKLIPSCPNVFNEDIITINNLLFQNNKCSETACGEGVILIFKDIIMNINNISPRLLCYYNSNNDTLIKNIQNGDFLINELFDCFNNQKTAVGYASLIYINQKDNNTLNKLFSPYEQYYLNHMCHTILVSKKKPENYIRLYSLTINKSLFVTITLNNRLRGCIGTLENHDNILNNIYKYSLASAFNDSRFEPMNNNEIRDCQLYITLLEQKNRLENGLTQYMKEYNIGNDGIELVINKKNRAFFLPSVGEDMSKDGLPHHEIKIRLLELLCKKSGLSDDKCYLDKTDFYINKGLKLHNI
jgi:uncharacterized protein (TIGR00296 family)/AmmeMemoRadiSam system protein B